MSEQKANSRDLEKEVVLRALKDSAFRAKLLAESKETVEAVAGTALPAELQIKVIEQEANTLYLVLPHLPEDLAGKEDLTEADLAQIAGGSGKPATAWCNYSSLQ